MPVECLGRDAQWGMERAFKGLLAAGVNDTIKFCRDAAVMWRHMESTLPITDRRGAKAAKALLEATRGPEWHGCTLTRFTEAYRRGDIVPDPTEQEREALSLYLVPTVNALIDEVLVQSGATKEAIRQQRLRHRQAD